MTYFKLKNKVFGKYCSVPFVIACKKGSFMTYLTNQSCLRVINFIKGTALWHKKCL